MNKEHYDTLLSGAEKWNQWRLENPDVRPDFSGANLRWADLTGADLTGAKQKEKCKTCGGTGTIWISDENEESDGCAEVACPERCWLKKNK